MPAATPTQLPLPIALSRSAGFGNFVRGANGPLVVALEGWNDGRAGGELFYLWGSAGSGRSHLLAAAGNAAGLRGLQVAYLPLADHAALSPAILEGLEHCDLVCLDDVDAVAGQVDWETALFHFYNRLRDAGHRVLVSADRSPPELPFGLRDLKTRLSWGLCYHLEPLDDDGKRVLLHQQAAERGLELSAEAADYLLARFPRDTQSLVTLMERLDAAALAAQKRLTIPFLRAQITGT